MLAYTYLEKGPFRLTDKPKPVLREPGDALVRVTLSSICTSDLHIKHGSVPRAVPGITVGQEMGAVGESVGPGVQTVRPGDRVSVNVETFCGECFFCRHGYVNNCTDPSGGWALGCRIDGGQAEYVRVPYADQGLTKIPESVTDRQALFAGDILATGFWAARIAEIGPEDTVLILGAGPTGICTLLCVLLKAPKQVIVCEKDPARLRFDKMNDWMQRVYDASVCPGALSPGADGGAGGGAGLHTGPQRPRRRGPGAGGSRGGGDLPPGLAVRPPQCGGDGGGALR